MNLLPNNELKLISRFLILMMVFAFSCDDIFVEDISKFIINLKEPSTGWQSKDSKVSFRWDGIPGTVNFKLEVVSPSFAVSHKLVFEKLLSVAKFDTSLISGEYEWRVKATNTASETAYTTSSFAITSPLNISSRLVTLLLPEDQSVSVLNDVDFRWNAVEGTGYYSLKIKKMNWVGDSVVVAKIHSTNFSFRLEDGVYAWGVAAIDTLTNKKTDYSIRSFSVDKNPPPVPRLLSPANRDSIYSLTVGFNWRKTELNATYTIDIYSDPELKNKVIEKIVSDTATYISMVKSGYYFWNVKSTDEHGNASNFSTASAFCIQLPTEIQQSLVQLMSPSNKSSLIDKKVTFWWTPLTGATKYNLQIATPSFASPLKLISDQWVTSTMITIELEPGNYEWRIKASNNLSETLYSQFSFSIYNNDLTKQKINLLSPLSAQLGNKSLVKFSWEKINSNVNYHLLIKKGSWDTGAIVQEMNTTKTEAEFSFTDGDYYWGIKAVDQQNGSESEYSTREFMVDLTPPEAPVLKSPENNLATGNYLIDFSWDTSDVTDLNLSYTLEIYQILNDVVGPLQTKTTQQKLIGYNIVTAGKYKWRVYATDNAGNQGAFSEYRFFEVRNDKDLTGSSVTIISPTDKSTVIEKNVTFWWTSLVGAEKYNLQIVSPSFSNPIKLVYDQWVTTNSVAVELESGNYEWRVKAANNTSETIFKQFSLSIYSNDLTKQKTTLLLPLSAQLGNKPLVKFSWEKINSNANYHLLVKKDSWETGAIVQEMNTPKTDVELSFLDGEYFWGVKAIDPLNNSETDYSVRNFGVDLTAPDIPRLKTPENNLATGDHLINFTWDPADVTDLKLSFTIEIYQVLINSVIQITTKTTQQTLIGLNIEASGKYKWRVFATDNAGNQSAMSEYRNFEIQSPKDLSLTSVSMISPIDNSMIIDKKVTFWWNALAGAEKYNLQIATPSFANPIKLIYDQWVTTNLVAVDLDGGTYEWRVKASNSISETGYSHSSLSIYNNDLTKQKTTLIMPLAEVLVNKSVVNFSWEKLNSNVNYHLLIKKDSWETGTVVQEISTNKTEIELTLLDGVYYWGIKAIDPLNNSETLYSTRKFGVDLTAPEIPKLTSPENSLVTGDHLINFAWEPADATDNKLTYTLEIYQILNSSVIPLTSKTTLQKLVGYNIDAPGKYKWRLSATDNAGNKSAFSEYRYFEVQSAKDLASATVSLLSPANGSTVIDKKVTFWWNSLSGAEKYNLQIVSPSFSNPLKLISDQWVTTNLAAVDLVAGNYEWRVKAVNSTSETIFSQSSLSVYANDLTQQKITLIRPLYSEIVNHSLMKFSWELLSSNVNYHLLIKKDSWESGTVIQEINNCKPDIELSFLDGEYYWGIKAVDPQNNSETAYSTRKFVVDLTPPEIPDLKSPANNLLTADYLIDFAWDPGDLTDTNLTYTLEMYKIINNVGNQMSSKITQQKTLGYNFDSAGKYKWRVYATDNAGNHSEFSEYRYFEIQ